MKCVVLSLLVFYTPFNVLGDDDRGDLCQGDEHIPTGKLPLDVQNEFFKIILGTLNGLGGSCLGVEPNYEKVELLLFNDYNPNTYTRIDPRNPVGIDNDASLHILSHGWLSGLNGFRIKAFREKYIKLFGKNILFVNWGKLAWHPYTTAACNVPFIGHHVAEFLCTLSEKQGYDLSKVHITGHSLGGQLAGHTGKQVQKLCNRTIGRITALDPAGPMFQLLNEGSRLNPKDAEFVEVVHSNSGIFGYLGKAGTVDYHLNCGSMQPGCLALTDLSNVAESSMYSLICPHMRSLEIWPYVLESQQFTAKSCQWCPFIIPGTCMTNVFGANYIVMGHTYKKPQHDHYNVITLPRAPFRIF